ncbi:hypothetical protein SAMN05444159_5796 [Bradyrhizobium lablabi]|uniref:Uncharacterized protein n=1 Tax=Bradyrhizobium lablabi TaxID=722472 RepID=A0A1M7AAS1_9BRAD|nr:hypothetical protein SAMN05444159_5796 [Bradyrhizobium lablabi]
MKRLLLGATAMLVLAGFTVVTAMTLFRLF